MRMRVQGFDRKLSSEKINAIVKAIFDSNVTSEIQKKHKVAVRISNVLDCEGTQFKKTSIKFCCIAFEFRKIFGRNTMGICNDVS